MYNQSWQLVKQLLLGKMKDVGTNVVINQEGGFAAAVVDLMAADRLVFSTQVPEQLVVLDPNLSTVDQQYVRILHRYKELLRNSGVVDADDVRAEKGDDTAASSASCSKGSSKKEPLTVRALFGKSKYGGRREAQETEAAEAPPVKKARTVKGSSAQIVAKKSKPPQSGETFINIARIQMCHSLSFQLR